MIRTLTITREVQTTLNLGEYTLVATQTIGQKSTAITAEQVFLVAGPRFVLESDQVLNVFPPPNTNGDYNNFLPNITLRRATLPWERLIAASLDHHPFLALLILSEHELARDVRVNNVRIADFCAGRTNKSPGQTNLSLESTDDPEARIPVVEADGLLLKQLLPTMQDLPLLVHVRQREQEPEEAVILGNRRPLPNTRYAAHLVSLEGLDLDKLGAGKVQLPSLYRWEFLCGQDKIGLVERLEELTCDRLRLPERPLGSKAFQTLRDDGYTALPYRLAWGDRTHALYRGPLLPVSIKESLEDSCKRAAGLDSGEGLIDYFNNLGLLDISLSTAFELGRMLLLRRREIAVSYYRFRRDEAALAAVLDNVSNDQHLVVYDTPPQLADIPPNDVVKFCMDLIDLKGIPFPYLLPEPQMLPEVSLRVFQIDWRWICCLLGGVLSTGRSRTVLRERERTYLQSLISAYCERMTSPAKARSGILLRSPVVAERPNQTYFIRNAAGEVLPLLRRERIGPDVLLLIVDGILQSFTGSEEPKAAHFGFKEGRDHDVETFMKDLRNPSTFAEIDGATVRVDKAHYRDEDRGILDVNKLASDFAMANNLNLIHAQSHHFALQLIESGARGMTIPVGGASQ